MKNAIELSVNFLVILVLGLVTFGLSIALVQKLTNSGFDALSVSQDQLDSQITKLTCKSQERICIANNNADMTAGKYEVIGVFVLNYLNTQGDFTLTVQTDSISFYDRDGLSQTYDNDLSIVPPTYTQSIDPKVQGKYALGIFAQKNARRGQYVIPIQITTTDAAYESVTSKITVTIS